MDIYTQIVNIKLIQVNEHANLYRMTPVSTFEQSICFNAKVIVVAEPLSSDISNYKVVVRLGRLVNVFTYEDAVTAVCCLLTEIDLTAAILS